MKGSSVFLIISLVFISCNFNIIDDWCLSPSVYFEIPVEFEPADSIIHLGDTIAITSTFQDELEDIYEKGTWAFDSIAPPMNYIIYRLDSIDNNVHNQLVYSNDDFVLLIDSSFFNIHPNLDHILGLKYKYSTSKNEYYLDFKLVAKKSGNYLFTFDCEANDTHLAGRYAEVHLVDGKCSTDAWYIYPKINGGINYREMLKESPNSYLSSTYYEIWNELDEGKHCFRVN